MTPTDAPRNIPVPDELAAVREQIKTLETHEAELRRLLITNPDLREGAAWLAEIKTVSVERTDLKELRANHADLVAEYTFPTEVTRVVLSGITEDGEIVPARSHAERREIWRHTVNAITTVAPPQLAYAEMERLAADMAR